MNAAQTIPAGTWVEIEKELLAPGQRAANLPTETRQHPYVMRVSGFLKADGITGEEATVTTLIGREHRGTLRTVNPSYTHSFGQTVPELLHIGLDREQV